MKVIAQTTLEEKGYSKSINLVEVLGMYTVIIAEKITEKFYTNRVYTSHDLTCDFMEALCRYKQDGGYIPDELKV